MEDLDFNLIVALDALLEHESVTLAARQLHTSAPAMSRTLARLRRRFGDPLLVRAGRRLVPTQRALDLRVEVAAVVARARELFVSTTADPAGFRGTLTVQSGEVLLAGLTGRLLRRVREDAPGLRLRFLPETDEGGGALRSGATDLEIGVLDIEHPEIRSTRLFTDRIVGIARADHPILRGRLTPRRFAAAAHLSVSRRGRLTGPIDEALAARGLERTVVTSLPGYASALLLYRDTDLVGIGPSLMSGYGLASLGLASFEIPLPLPDVEIGMAWHPRREADPAHRWLRSVVTELAGVVHNVSP